MSNFEFRSYKFLLDWDGNQIPVIKETPQRLRVLFKGAETNVSRARLASGGSFCPNWNKYRNDLFTHSLFTPAGFAIAKTKATKTPRKHIEVKPSFGWQPATTRYMSAEDLREAAKRFLQEADALDTDAAQRVEEARKMLNPEDLEEFEKIL
jgi:hypothetical protein